jgi:hypothetical protein
MNGLHLMKIEVVNVFRCSPATAPENSLDDTKQRCQLVETPSAECCSKSKFSPRGNSGFNIELSRGTIEKGLIVLLQATCKTTSLSCVPNSPSDYQAQGVNVSKIKYDDANKVNNNAIK